MMFFRKMRIVSILLFVMASSDGEFCPNNRRLIHVGKINATMEANITRIHNNYRLKIAQGLLAGQPQGINLYRLFYDRQLAASARKASLTCEMKNVNITDARWYSVGQNMYMEYNNVANPTQNWDAAIASWFEEYKHYLFPDNVTIFASISPKATVHYTQLVWANTHNIGCDFVMFYESGRDYTPFGKLYTCVYGPGGNEMGKAPYITGNSNECYQLC